MLKRIRLLFKNNRDHIAYDVLSEFRKLNVGIVWMEVYTKDLYIKFDIKNEELYQKLLENLHTVRDLDSISEVDLIAFETRNYQTNEIVNLLGRLVLIVDCNGIIKYSNISSELKAVKDELSDIVGKPISEIIEDKDFIKKVMDPNLEEDIEELSIGKGEFIAKMYRKTFKDSNMQGKIIIIDDISNLNTYTDKKYYSSHITFKDLIFESPLMEKCVNTAKEFSQMDVEILITGESGTGKELFTRAIHNLSSRRDKPFIAINCTSLPEQLLESELFGYEDGSFTGAIKGGKAGIFESCNGGTIFLDEIGDMPVNLQAKLLRVLQEKRIRRIGGSEEIPVNFRLISATNQDLRTKMSNREFRLDLMYRLNTLSLSIPPLRSRKEDIKPLVKYFTEKYSQNNEEVTYTEDAISALKNYNYPGNVRELQNIIIRALTTLRGNEINSYDLKFYFEDSVDATDETFDKKIENFEKKLIIAAFESGNSIRQTAQDLGITHTRLLNRMKKYNIERDEV